MIATVFTLVAWICCTPGAPATESWPGLRGPSHDGAVHGVELFPGAGGGLVIGWQRGLGSGYPVVVVDESRVVAAFQAGAHDVVAAFDPKNGDEIWRQTINDAYPAHSGAHGGPIATPFLAAGRVFGLGPRGDLYALDAASGEKLWQLDLVAEFEAEAPYYGFASSPLVVDGVLVVEIGGGEGKAFAGFDPDTGKVLWTAGTDTVRYQSPIVATIGGEEQLLVVGNKTLSALDPATGSMLWSYEHDGDERDMGGSTIVPVPSGEGRVLLMNTHPTSVMLRITRSARGSAFQVEELWSGGSLKSSYVQPVYHDGHLYGMNSKIFTCVDAATGEMVWRSRDAGDGFPTRVGDHLVIVNKSGTLRVAKASPAGYEEVAALDLFAEHSWTAPAYAGGHLWVRSMGSLARIDIVAADPVTAAEVPWLVSTDFGRFLARLETAEDKTAAVDAYLAEQSSFPIVEDSGAVHFVFRGDARDVGIIGDMIGYRREDPMTRVAGTDLFYYSTRLEPDAALGYGFIVDYGDPIPDPLNPGTQEGVFDEMSWFAMPAWRQSEFLDEVAAASRGSLETIEWASEVREGQLRRATVYLPVGYDPTADRRYPTLYFLAGEDALEKGAFKNTLDHLIGREIQPVIAVFVLPDAETGDRDLWPTEEYLGLVVQELLPRIDGQFRTRPEAAQRAVVGAADAADTAFLAAFRHPDIFGRVGALWPIVFGPDLEEALPSAAEQHLVIYDTWGTYHLRSPHEAWDQVVENRAFFQMLRDAGYRPAGGEVPEGVGWMMFRGYTDDMLRALFPAP